MSTSITFLRHAQTDANTGGKFSGADDLPLNAEGEARALQTAEELAGERFDVILYGRAKRVLQTTDYLLSRLQAVPKIILKSDSIREMNFGLFEGLTADEIRQKYPNIVIIIAHSGRCYTPWHFERALDGMGEELRGYYFDTAAVAAPQNMAWLRILVLSPGSMPLACSGTMI